MQPFLFKETRNKIVEVMVEGIPTSAQEEQKVESRLSYLDYSEGMAAEEQKRYINYLAERVNADDLEKRAMKLVLQDFLDKQKEYDVRLSKLDAVLSDVEELKKNIASEVKRRKAAERKVDDLNAKLKFANKNRFGDKSHRTKKKTQMKSQIVPKTRMITLRQHLKIDLDKDPSKITYHSIIRTVKMQGRSAWKYLGKFFTKSLIKRIESSLLELLSVKTLSNVFNGCRDFFSMRPDKFSCQRVQSQNLFELCRVQPKIMKINRIGNMPTFSISENNESLLLNCRAKKMYEILKNK